MQAKTPPVSLAKAPITLAELGALGRPMHVRAEALVLDNFKSFPKWTRIPLPDGFTTISGPNGSGKSNIIDALQFVLSTSSSKGMRGVTSTLLTLFTETFFAPGTPLRWDPFQQEQGIF